MSPVATQLASAWSAPGEVDAGCCWVVWEEVVVAGPLDACLAPPHPATTTVTATAAKRIRPRFMT